jgi:uncharacterized protein YacL
VEAFVYLVNDFDKISYIECMKDRVIRFGLTGLTFMLSIIFGVWYFGGQEILTCIFKYISTSNNIIDLFGIVIPIITSPIIGFIISSTGIGLIECCWWKKWTLFLEPTAKLRNEYLQLIHDKFDQGSGIDFNNETSTYTISDHSLVYLNHQTLFRQRARGEVMEFTLRRMDLYRSYENTAFSILYGLFIGLFINFFLRGTLGQISYTKICWILPIFLYFFFGFAQAKKALTESNNFEKKVLLAMYKKEVAVKPDTMLDK